MKKENTLPLNTNFVNERIKELGLKQIWLASKIGVDKITINRWISGKVKRIAVHNAELLAKCLECKVDDLTLKSDITEYSVSVNPNIDSIINESIVSILRPFGKFDMAESIIKASLHTGLSMDQLAEAYKCLYSTNFYKYNYDEALIYAYKCLSISKRINNKRLFFISLLNIASVKACLSEYDASSKILFYCLQMIDILTIPKELSTFYNNLAALCSTLCKFNESEHFYKEAIKCLEGTKNYLKISISARNLCSLYIELNNLEEAANICSTAYKYSINSNYNEGIIKCTMYKTDILVLSKQIELAKKVQKYDVASLMENNIKSLYVYEILARYYRFCNNYEKAIEAIEKGIAFCDSDACDEGKMLQERARLAIAMGNNREEIKYRQKANAVFKKYKLYNRIYKHTIVEYGQLFL